ncbi:MBOAT, membrane-bound O-acyltransferase family-domain-containing protein [Mycotypha africana]|uniref:MBOAT, membrane-bound O-acyltransferase family-domain-containing protein n=1 Tax=Mycotypha africana TaxID=64632 RepID=UPI0023008659|nr:MBOAT, membrane-bound O-acyltransferase family-domain-containing protein [Mycotypha africana]KAI8984455.1 MBOAT, membrane-bound O-acyltransferase family-domain-containing protein [Mycotypha africana]
MNIITLLVSKVTGVPEPSIRLFLTLLLAYPIGYIYHQKYNIQKPDASRYVRNEFIVKTGLVLSFFFNGASMMHSTITILISYFLCHVGDEIYHNRRIGTLLVWTFNLSYLLLGYYFTASNDYDINWTTSQCVLCLRLMGFSMDYMDGLADNGEVAKTQAAKASTATEQTLTGPHSFASDSPLKELPDIREFMGYCYLPPAFLIGPQFSFSLYQRFLNGPYNGTKPANKGLVEKAQMTYTARCLVLGLIYIVFLQVMGAIYPSSYLLTSDYASRSFLARNIIYYLCGKQVIVKYIGVWLITEGACTLFGINYQGYNAKGEPDFRGLANCNPFELETMTTFDRFISDFNINTNLWVKQYVFKRLRFLGNKMLSQLGALFFLAVWHGFHFNYFDTFFLEFLYTADERILRAVLYNPVVKPLMERNYLVYRIWKVLAWITATSSLFYAAVGFDLLSLQKMVVARKNVYWYGHMFVLAIFALGFILNKTKHTRRMNRMANSANKAPGKTD